MPEYAQRVRAARAFAGLHQHELAERIGTSTQSIKRWEDPADGQAPKLHHRIAIAATCQVPPEFMELGFGDIDEPEIRERLERIEVALTGGDLEPVRDYVRTVISELAAGEINGADDAPTPSRAPGRRRADQS